MWLSFVASTIPWEQSLAHQRAFFSFPCSLLMSSWQQLCRSFVPLNPEILVQDGGRQHSKWERGYTQTPSNLFLLLFQTCKIRPTKKVNCSPNRGRGLKSKLLSKFRPSIMGSELFSLLYGWYVRLFMPECYTFLLSLVGGGWITKLVIFEGELRNVRFVMVLFKIQYT